MLSVEDGELESMEEDETDYTEGDTGHYPVKWVSYTVKAGYKDHLSDINISQSKRCFLIEIAWTIGAAYQFQNVCLMIRMRGWPEL